MKIIIKARLDFIVKGNKELEIVVKNLSKDLEKVLNDFLNKIEVKQK